MNVLFLGAGKRLSLMEAFERAGRSEGVELRLFSVELTPTVPVVAAAEVMVGPWFGSPEFAPFLRSTVENLGIDIVVPNMDSATVALGPAKGDLARIGCWAVVSDTALCEAMLDKASASSWFSAHNIPQPDVDEYPSIAKARFGSGSRDQFVARDASELASFLAERPSREYFVQLFITGQEYSVDAYVDRAGAVRGLMSRKRIEVVDGEVEVSEAHHHPAVLELSHRILEQPGWSGPITLQFIDGEGGPVAIEVNPRFGGGVTHAIHCGLDMPAWLLREKLGRDLPPPPEWIDGSLMTRCRRDVFHDPQR